MSLTVPYKVGDKVFTSKGEMAIIKSLQSGRKNKPRRALLRFTDGTEITVSTPKLKGGNFINPNSKSVYGVGYIGKGRFYSSKDGISTKSYTIWHSMMERCYSNPAQYPAYVDCVVCEEWHNYQVFAKWYYENSPDKHADYHLDKDLLGDGRLYSPENCCLLKATMNLGLRSLRNCSITKVRGGKFRVKSINENKELEIGSEIEAKIMQTNFRIEKVLINLRDLKRNCKDIRILNKYEEILKDLIVDVKEHYDQLCKGLLGEENITIVEFDGGK